MNLIRLIPLAAIAAFMLVAWLMVWQESRGGK